MKKKEHSFNVLLDPDQYAMLTQLAELRAIPRGAVIRQLVIGAHAMQAQGKASCATGQACYVPHMHPRTAVQPPPINPAA